MTASSAMPTGRTPSRLSTCSTSRACSVEASLAREESRDALIRPEYPETDDANWKCALAYTRAEDGTLSYEKIPY